METRCVPAPCPACGEEVKASADHAERLWASSPCRAEHSGAIQVVLPSVALPARALEGGKGPGQEFHSAKAALGGWASGLELAAGFIAELAALLEDTEDEALVHLLMGAERDTQAVLLKGRPDTMFLAGLAPAVARRVAQSSSRADGPDDVAESLEDLIRERAQRNPADGSDGDGT